MCQCFCYMVFFNDTATTEIYTYGHTLSLHDALPSSSAAASRLDLDVAALNRLMGGEGKTAGGILQYSFPRAERLMDGDMETPPTMGTATAINFQPTGDGRAAITGDFVLVANRSEEHTSELQSLMRISYAVFCLKKTTHQPN